MANRKTRPTSPGRRFGTYQLREELSGDAPDEAPDRGQEALQRPQRRTAASPRATAAAAPSGCTGEIDFKRTKDGVPAKVATIEYDPNRSAYIALLQLRRRREALHPRPAGARGRRRGRLGRGRRHHPGQRAAAEPDPDGHRGPQRRADARPGRPPRPRRRHRDPGGGQGGPDGLAAAALLGGADGPRRVPRHGRLALQRRAPERQGGARPAAAATAASARRPAASP